MHALQAQAPSAPRTRRRVARWIAGLSVGVALALAGVDASAVPPAAGTSIGNQATATYTDSSGISRTVTSNATQTVVQQVAALTLAASGAKTATIGGTVYYPHTLTNTGNGNDNFTLSAVNAAAQTFNMTGIAIYADNGSGAPTGPAITTPVALAAGGVFKFVVAATVPTTASAGQQNAMTVTATSGYTTTVTTTNTDTTTVTVNAVIALSKSISAASGPPNGTTQYTYSISYTNTGNSGASNLKITDLLPTGMSYVANSGLWSVTGATQLKNPTPPSTTPLQYGTAPNQITYDFGVTTANTLTAVITNVAPGQSGTLSFQVTVNTGTAAGTLFNTANMAYDDTPTGNNLITGSSNTVGFTVTKVAGVAITSSTVASAVLGNSFTFSNTITNNGNTADTFNVALAAGTTAFPAGTTFQLLKSDGVTPLIDTNSDGISDTGPIAAGGTYTVFVKVTLPATSTGTPPFLENITATSTVTPTTAATGLETLSAVTGGASIDVTNSTPYGAAALGYGAGPEAAAVLNVATNPGASATFPLYVNNRGTIADTYNLSSTLALPGGWTVTFYADGGAGNCSTLGGPITATPTINSLASSTVCAVVTVPAGNAPGTVDFNFRALSPVTGAGDTIHDAVTVNVVRSLTFTTNNTGQASIGGVVYYTHVLKNTGNVVEGNGTVSTITLAAANNQAGWTSVLYYDAAGTGTYAATDPAISGNLNTTTGLAAGLAPGQSITIFDKVSVPASSADGVVDVTTLTVTTSQGTYTATVPAVLSNTDTTTVVAGNVTLVKTQVLDAACAGAASGFSTAQVNALPGACVTYQITVQNIGSTNATNVTVSDATPAYTTLAAKPVPSLTPAISGVSPSAPAAGSAGTVGVVIPTLTPGQSEVLTFGVQIQQ